MFTQDEKWVVSEGKKGKALEFTGISGYKPAHRSPHTFGFIKDVVVGNFVLEADLGKNKRQKQKKRSRCLTSGAETSANDRLRKGIAFSLPHFKLAAADQVVIGIDLDRVSALGVFRSFVVNERQLLAGVIEEDLLGGGVELFFSIEDKSA